ncbi:MAG: chemotaxis response regulator protein-glutamate methylesterase, partial [Sulfobacillus benefaciens]
MSQKESAGLRAVIVDDSAYVRYVLKTRLESLGVDVVGTFARGEPAIDQVPMLNP